MGFNPLDELLKAVQYPQSVLSGVAKFAPGMHGQGHKGTGKVSSLKEGLRGGLTPSDVGQERLSEGEKEQIANNAAAKVAAQVAMTGSDVSLDPLLAVGMGSSGVKFLEGKKAGELLKAAGTFGPMSKEAGLANRGAQLARRMYQGALMSGGDPAMALSAGILMGPAERASGKLISMLGTHAADELVGDGISKLMPSKEIDDAYEAAKKTLGLDMEGGPAGAGFRRIPEEELGTPAHQMALEKWSPSPANSMVAPPSDHPSVRRARELLLSGKAGTTPEGLAGDLFPKDAKAAQNFLWQESSPVLGQLAREGVVGPRQGAVGFRDILGDPSRLDRTRVPDIFGGQGARFNEELLQSGSPVLNPTSPPALPPGPEYRQVAGPAIPMGRVPMGQAMELSNDLGAQLGRIPQVPTAAGVPGAGVGAMPSTPQELVSGPPVRAMGPPSPVQKQAADFLANQPPDIQKKLTYLKAKAVQGDKRAMLALANLMESLDEDPAERLIRLATGG